MVVGQKVVCINDIFAPDVAQFYVALPKKGQVYVIRNVLVGVSIKGTLGEVCLYLIGMHNPKSAAPPFPERGFNSERFAPLEEYQQRNTETELEPAEKELIEK